MKRLIIPIHSTKFIFSRRQWFYIFSVVTACLFLFMPNRLNAQFYNGSTMTFGKSRIQYDDRFWMFYRYERFETFFYQGGKNLAIYTAQYAEIRLKEMEKEMDYSIDKNIQFVIFNKLSDLKQSNIGLSSDDSYNCLLYTSPSPRD